MSSINLEKGQKIDLTKGSPGLHRFYVGLGWSEPTQQGGYDYDLDVSALLCHDDGNGPKLLSNGHFVFYNNLDDPEHSVHHTGDNTTGKGAGDDEVIIIDVDKLRADCDEVSVVVTIFEGAQRNQNFGAIKNSYIRICEANPDNTPGTEIAKYELDEDYTLFTAIQFGSVYKKGGEWKFDAVGQGFKADLSAVLDQYGAV